MIRSAATTLALLLVLLATGCSSTAEDPAATQEAFGVRMAKMNLWREAMFRFRRAVELNPKDAMAHNNLAVAYEANGDFESAAKAYREAMRLDKSNQYIQKNYSRFVEFTTRDRRRQQRRAATQAATAATTTTAPQPEGTPPAAPTPAPTTPAAPPVASTPEETAAPSDPAAAPGSNPSPTGSAPAATPAPNPAPPPPPSHPPGGQS